MKTKILACTEATYLSSGYARYYNALLNYLHSTGEFDICELASWGDNADPRSASVPWRFIGNLPFGATTHQPNPAEMAEYESNPYNKFGAWKFNKVCLDFKPDIVCFPPDKLVFTSKGYVPIQDIKIGDYVLTHTGRFNKVVQTMKREYKGHLVNISVNGNTEKLVCTPEHPVYNLTFRKRSTTTRKNSDTYKNSTPIFTPAINLLKGDLVCMPIAEEKNIDTCLVIYSSHYIKNYYLENDYVCFGSKNRIKNTIEINDKFAILLGYIIGDGHINKTGVYITFGENEEKFCQEAVSLFCNIFDIKATYKHSKEKKCWVVSCNSKFVSEFYKNLIQKHQIPEVIWMSNNTVKKALIKGLVRSDGCYKKNTVSFCTTNKVLANNYRQLCTQVGIPTNISSKKLKNNSKSTAYEINGYGTSAIELHNIVNKYEQQWNDQPKTRQNRHVQKINNNIVSSIKRVRRYENEYHGLVFNLEVENDNSYIVEGFCVHNCDIRDIWHAQHTVSSPLRKYYKLLLMPAVDAEPQKDEWISFYKNADAVFTYTDWARNLLNDVGGGLINTVGTASPVCDSVFHPVANINEHKIKMGFSPEMKVIGTVMRNQRRKLFPSLFEAFEEYILSNNINDTYLYCHTSYPDDGFDFPSLIKKSRIGHKVIFTYVCRNCGNVTPGFFKDAKTVCPHCNTYSFGMPNTTVSVSNDVLAAIYNCFDVYVQYASLEGFGMPVVEAAACGIPVMATDYSAMSETVRKLGGTPIPVKNFNVEMESGRKWAYPDKDKFINELKQFFSLSELDRQVRAYTTRQLFEDNYNSWGRVGKVWYDVIKQIPPNNLWQSPPDIHNPPPFNERPDISNTDYVRWLMKDVLGQPELIGTYMELRMIRDLNFGATNYGMGGSYHSEETCEVINIRMEDFNRKKAYDHMLGLCEQKNAIERLR